MALFYRIVALMLISFSAAYGWCPGELWPPDFVPHEPNWDQMDPNNPNDPRIVQVSAKICESEDSS